MATATDADRRRRPYRRDQIIRAAVKLFHDQGYQATSMEEIGAAVGLSGPSLYRHFTSKLDILEAGVAATWNTFDRAVADLGARELAPADHLAALVQIYAKALLADPVLTAVWVRERGSLGSDIRREVDRVDRQVMQNWVESLSRVRPELDAGEARLLVRGALQLCLSMSTSSTRLGRERVAELIERSMLAALLA